VTVIQRFGGGLNLNVHFHTLVLEGVFTATDDGGVRFHPLPAPTDEEVARVLATVATRVRRLLRRRGLEAGEGRDLPPDPLAEESGALAAVASASVQGRVALGARAGRRVLRLGRDPDAPWITSRGPRRRTWTDSTCTPTFQRRRATSRGSSTAAATCSAHRLRTSGSRSRPTAAPSSR